MQGQGECGGYFSVKLASYAIIVCYNPHSCTFNIIDDQCSVQGEPKNVAVLLWVINPLPFQNKTENPRDFNAIKQNSNSYIFM